VSEDRCHTCDRPKASDADWKHHDECADVEHDCFAGKCWEYQCKPVDWRARALLAEAVADAVLDLRQDRTVCAMCNSHVNCSDWCPMPAYEAAKAAREKTT
jgi:hypothetical protein